MITKEQEQQLIDLNDSRVNNILGINKLEIGRWFKYPDLGDGKLMFMFNGEYGNEITYGFSSSGKWLDKIGVHKDDDYELATFLEIRNSLVKEAKLRGLLNIGDIGIKTVNNNTCKKGSFNTCYNEYAFDEVNNTLILDGVTIFNKGVWAEVIKSAPSKDNIKKQIAELLKQL